MRILSKAYLWLIHFWSDALRFCDNLFINQIHTKIHRDGLAEFKTLRESEKIQQFHLQQHIQVLSHRNTLVISILAFCVGSSVALFGFGIIASYNVDYIEIDLNDDGIKESIKPVTWLFFTSGIILFMGAITLILGLSRAMVLWKVIQLIQENMDMADRGIRVPRIVSKEGEILLLSAIVVMLFFVAMIFFLFYLTLQGSDQFNVVYVMKCQVINGEKVCQ